MYCRFCGNMLPDDSKFCSSCGHAQRWFLTKNVLIVCYNAAKLQAKNPSVDEYKLKKELLTKTSHTPKVC